MADSQVWRYLPAEILCCIIDQTDDQKTLQSWMRTCKSLRKIVGSRIWSEIHFSGGSFRWPRGRGSYVWLKHDPRELPLEGDHVKTLSLFCYYARPPSVDGKMAHMVVSERIAQTIDDGFRHLSLPRAILQTGVLWQDFIDRIVRKSRLRTLKIRGGTFPPTKIIPILDYSPLQVRHAAGLRLKFEGLGMVPSLRCLWICCLLPGEGHGLATAVKRLSNLELLRIQVATKHYPFYLGPDEVPEVSPLDEFFKYMYPCPRRTGHHGFESGPTYGFPTSLRKLGLVDTVTRSTKLTSSFFATRVIPHPNLRSLTINLSFVLWQEHLFLPSILAAYISPNITDLYIAPFGAQRALASILYPFRNSMRVWGLPAWHSFYKFKSSGDILDLELFAGLAYYRQVCVRSGGHRRQDRRFLSGHLLDRVPAWSGTTRPVLGRWGSNLRHFRIEDVDVSRLAVDRINFPDSNLADLKVLVIKARDLPPDSKPRFHRRTIAYSIAAQILRQRLPALRVVVVGEYRFWLEFPDIFSKGPRRVWGLSEAMGDVRQVIDVERCLELRDWWFLNGQDGVEEGSMVIRRE